MLHKLNHRKGYEFCNLRLCLERMLALLIAFIPNIPKILLQKYLIGNAKLWFNYITFKKKLQQHLEEFSMNKKENFTTIKSGFIIIYEKTKSDF